jgi:amino acid transporter
MTALPDPADRPSRIASALAANRLGVASVTFFVMSAVAPLTVVATVVTTGYATTGLTGIPFAFLVIGLMLALFSVGFVTMAPYVANTGAFYAYISRGLGRPMGVASSWLAVAIYNGLQVAFYGTIGAAAEPVLGWFGIDVAWWVIALVAWALIALLGVQQVDVNSKVLAVLLISEVLVTLVLCVANVIKPAGGTVSFETLDPGNLFGPGVGAVLAVALLGFIGFESAVVFSEESRDPGRTVRRATFLSVGLIAGIYAFGSWAMSVATGPDRIVGAAHEQGTQLIFNLAENNVGGAIVGVGRVLFVTSILAAALSFHNTAARYMFAVGRERVLPSVLGRTSLRTGAPVVGSLVQSVIGLIVIIVYAVADMGDPVVQLFYWWGTSGGVGVLVLIATTSIAVIVFFLRNPSDESVWRRLVAPILSVAAVGTVVTLAFVNFATLLGVPEDSPLRWGVPISFVVVAALGFCWALVLRARRPDIYASVGLGAKSAALQAGYDPTAPPTTMTR